jgi:malonyl-CoA/methylmalonyl-CoA synthetase
MSGNLYSAFARAAAEAGGRLFLDTGDSRSVSFAALDDRVGRVASVLVAKGVTPGDRVAVQVEKSPEAVLLYLAVLRLGAIFVPLNSAYTAAEIKGFVDDAEPALLVCAPKDESAYQGFAPALLTLGADGGGSLTGAAAGAAPPVAGRDAEDLAAILYTSGTTGRSKGAMLSHRALGANARTLVGVWRWSEHDILVHALPINHVHGLFVGLHLPLLTGSTVRFLPKFDVEPVIAALAGATAMMGVPTFYTRLLDSPDFTRALAEGMRIFISGSAPLLPQTFAAFEERTGHAILERYGMTEAGMITSNPYEGPRLAGTVGFPLPGTEARIGGGGSGPGVLEIRGPGLFSGYWRMPEKTAEEHSADGWFITGDIATIAEDGRVAIVGRAKDLIIAGGYNIYPKEIELLIDAVPGVVESAVIGVPHPDLGEAVVAIVIAEPGARLSGEALIDAIAPGLARFKQPRRVLIVPSLPRNAMGKVEKAKLRAEYSGLFRD